MKYIFQLLIILTCLFLGEIVKYFVNLPIPSSVYGLLFLFLALLLKIVKLENVEKISYFFISIMPVFFIAPAVSIIGVDIYLKLFLGILFVVFISTVIVMLSTSLFIEFFMNRRNEK